MKGLQMTCCHINDRKDRNSIWRESEVNFKQNSREEVDHPTHYHKASGFEVIDAWGLDFTLGNSIKYISRAGHKNKVKAGQDLQKALWYLLRAMNKEEKYNSIVN